MEKNLISNFEIDDVDKKLARKNVRLSLVFIVGSIIFFFSETADWYGILQRSLNSKMSGDHFLYAYRISPVITFLEMILLIITNAFYYNGWKHQLVSIEEGDTKLFNKSLRYFNIGLTLSVSYYLLYFSRVVFRSIYYQW